MIKILETVLSGKSTLAIIVITSMLLVALGKVNNNYHIVQFFEPAFHIFSAVFLFFLVLTIIRNIRSF